MITNNYDQNREFDNLLRSVLCYSIIYYKYGIMSLICHKYLSILLFYKLIRFVKLAIESNILEYLSITILSLSNNSKYKFL